MIGAGVRHCEAIGRPAGFKVPGDPCFIDQHHRKVEDRTVVDGMDSNADDWSSEPAPRSEGDWLKS